MMLTSERPYTRDDLTGRRFGRLSVTGFAGTRAHRRYWMCACECGRQTTVDTSSLIKGRTQSCGCLQRDTVAAIVFKHGYAKPMTPEYRAWADMKSRCLKPQHEWYPDYGGRGITICAAWLNSFETFLADMGNRPGPGFSLDRRDNDGNYEPGNCRWATQSQQNANKRRRRKGTL